MGRHIFRLHSVFEFSSLFISHYEECSLGDVTITQILSLRGPDLRTAMELRTDNCTLCKHIHRTVIYAGNPKCKLCGLTERTAWHVTHECEALGRRRC
jgi:hypothetical protein